MRHCKRPSPTCAVIVGSNVGSMGPMEQQAGNKLYELDIPVRWGDMDPLGHVNNIMYFRYFEQTRLSWYESVGFDALKVDDTGLLIVDNHAEYLKPLVYPAVATITMTGHSPGRSSFISEYWLTSNDVLFTRGKSKVVWVDNTKGKSVPLPDSIRALVETE